MHENQGSVKPPHHPPSEAAPAVPSSERVSSTFLALKGRLALVDPTALLVGSQLLKTKVRTVLTSNVQHITDTQLKLLYSA